MEQTEERKMKLKDIPYFRIWANMFNFSGKQKRKDFFIDIIINIIVVIAFAFLGANIINKFNNTLLELSIMGIYFFMGEFLSLSLIARRINDAGIPWTYCFISLAPVFGWSIIIMCFFKSRSADDIQVSINKRRVFIAMGITTPALFFTFILAFVIVLLVFPPVDNTQEAKTEFMQYFDGKNDVALHYYTYISFQEYKIDLEKNLSKREELTNGQIIYNDHIYFTTAKEVGVFNLKYIFNIYKMDLLGENIELVFSKDGYETCPWAYDFEKDFYIEHYLKNVFYEESRRIDKYNIVTGIYENIDGGKDSDIDDYIKKEVESDYKIEIKTNELSNEVLPNDHGYFIITDSKNDKEIIIDDNYLKTTIYYESMYKFNYSPMQYNISNNHILLSYIIGASDGFNCTYVVFEYSFDTNDFKFKLLAFPIDRYDNEVMYVGDE